MNRTLCVSLTHSHSLNCDEVPAHCEEVNCDEVNCDEVKCDEVKCDEVKCDEVPAPVNRAGLPELLEGGDAGLDRLEGPVGWAPWGGGHVYVGP